MLSKRGSASLHVDLIVSGSTPSEVDKRAELLHSGWHITVPAKCGGQWCSVPCYLGCLFVTRSRVEETVKTVIRSLPCIDQFATACGSEKRESVFHLAASSSASKDGKNVND